MPGKDQQQVEAIFHSALDMPAENRAAYLAEASSGDESLYVEVESLISALENNGGAFLDESTLRLGMEVLSNSLNDSMTGKSIGAYKVLAPLGKGGMGEVYLAEDTRLGRKVALKFLSREFVGDNWAKRQLVKEAQAVAMLDHPNICPVYGMEEYDDHSFIVMQYVEGKTLADLIRTGSMPDNQVLSVAQQIVGALVEAHAHGIIHRDIKPKNIMVTPANHVKVLDFGLAKTVRQKKLIGAHDDSVSHFSASGQRVGTVSYMSPEQLRGETLDYRSDIFSLGTVLYELGGGKNPFAKKSEAETISAILAETTPPLNRSSSEIAESLDRITRKCLVKQKESRYQSASELLLAFQSLQDSSRSRPFPIGIRSIALVALLVTLIISGLSTYFREPPVRTLAILPFGNQTGDANIDYLSAGIGNSLIDRLSFASGLRVLTNTAVSGYKGREGDPEVVGRDLKVDAVMVGKLVKDGERVILQTRLVNTSDGAELWQTNSGVQLPEILNLQKDISAMVLSSLNASLNPEKDKARAIGQTDNPNAFRLYLMGRSYWEKGMIDDAISSFKQATDLDPIFALAWAGLADSYALQPTVAYGSVATEEAMPKARAAARRALEMGDSLSEAHISMGVVKLRYEWQWREAEEHFKRAIELNPDRAAAHVGYASLLTITGRFEEAITETRKAKDLDPFNPIAVMSLGRAYYRAREFDKAIDYLKKVLSEHPTNVNASYVLGYAYLKKGMLDQAIITFENLSTSNKWLAAAPLGYAYAKDGQRAKAERILDDMEKQSQKTDPREKKIPAQERAIIYIGLGDRDKAFSWLEKAHAERFPSIISLTTEPIFDDLRADPRFADLARRINLTP